MEGSIFQVLVLIITGLGAIAMFFMAFSFNRGVRDKDKIDEVLKEIFKTLGELKVDLVKIASSNNLVERSIEHLEKRTDSIQLLVDSSNKEIERLNFFKHKHEADYKNILEIIKSIDNSNKERE